MDEVGCRVNQGRLRVPWIHMSSGPDLRPLKPSELDLDLIHAAAEGDLAAVRTLLDAGADVNATCHNGSAVQFAAAKGDAVMLRLLLGRGARTDAVSGQAPLLMAAANEHTETVRALVEAGADVNIRDENGVTALLVAAVNGQADMGKVLLDAHATPNVLAARIESVPPERGTDGDAPELEASDFVPRMAAEAGGIGTSPRM